MKSFVRPLLAALLLLLGIAGCTSLDNWQRKAIFQNERAGWSPYGTDLSGAPADVEASDLALANGDTVHAWFVRAERADAPTVLYLHGARRNLHGSRYRIDRLRELGFNVLAIDYRGFGRSTALLPSEDTALEDSRRAFAELARREPDPARRFVYGYSLGGALAIALAAELDGMSGVIVESTFTSIADLVRASRWGWVPFLSSIVTQEFDSGARISKVNEPLLLLHGTRDGVIPHDMSDRLYAAAMHVPVPLKRVVKFDGASHRGVPFVAAAEFDRSVREFAALARRSFGAIGSPHTEAAAFESTH
jgi:hypothetical protein